jgi:hypothetical protein
LQYMHYRGGGVFINLVSDDEEEESHFHFCDKVVVPREILARPYPWLSGKNVSDGMNRAIVDAAAKRGPLANQVYFADQLMWDAEDSQQFMSQNARAFSNRQNRLKPEHRYIVWYLNLAPMEAMDASQTATKKHFFFPALSF